LLAGSAGCRAPQQVPWDDELRRAVLSSVGEQVVAPATVEFAARADALGASVDAHALAVDDPDAGPPALAQAQAAWGAAMVQWQQLEVMQVGPAAPASAPGGESLRDEIYSWPTANTCAVDRAVVGQDYLEADFIETGLVHAYGLDALEYLLFSHAPAHTCPAQIQLDGEWDALGIDEIERRRAAYANVVAAEVRRRASTLADRWHGDAGFGKLLANPGEGGSPYANTQQAVDDVFRAMFYVDLSTKDAKLGKPLGVIEGCDAPPCLEFLESPFAGVGAPSVSANLVALKALVLGGPDAESGQGFDELASDVGHGEVAETLLADIDAAIVAAEAIELPLAEAMVSDPGKVDALHVAIKQVTDTLKGPIVMILRLQVPSEGAGDND
jgi:predicted lipoprotein